LDPGPGTIETSVGAGCGCVIESEGLALGGDRTRSAVTRPVADAASFVSPDTAHRLWETQAKVDLFGRAVRFSRRSRANAYRALRRAYSRRDAPGTILIPVRHASWHLATALASHSAGPGGTPRSGLTRRVLVAGGLAHRPLGAKPRRREFARPTQSRRAAGAVAGTAQSDLDQWVGAGRDLAWRLPVIGP
jgi:hypothetical protein